MEKIMDKYRNPLIFAIIAVNLVLAVISWLLLPDKVGMQLGINGQLHNFMPKIVAVSLPMLVSIVCAVGYKSSNSGKTLLISLVFMCLPVVTLLFNCL